MPPSELEVARRHHATMDLVPSMPSYRILTLRQPWAWALVTGLKDVENRSWTTRYRGLLFIHAARTLDQAGMLALGAPKQLCRGAVVGSVQLVDVVQDYPSPWAQPSHWHWVVSDPKVLEEPLPMKGRLGLWRARLPRAVVKRCQPD